MNDEPRKKLRDLIEQYGRCLCDDVKRCKGLLQDACPGHRKEIFVLVSALEEKVVLDLLAGLGGQPWDAVARRLARRLIDSRAVADQYAYWAVESWALALGVIGEDISIRSEPSWPETEPTGSAAMGSVTTNAGKILLKVIRAGEFWMGSPDDDEDAASDEKPSCRVRISRAFYMGATPVTQAQYQAITGKNWSHFHGWPDNPVERVSWADALLFCNELSQKEGLAPHYVIRNSDQAVIAGGVGYRLPTEAEWEYTCRAGTETAYSFGDDAGLLDKYAWYQSNSEGQPWPVGTKLPNAWGLYDMHGNVWEWCWDSFDENYYRQSPGVDPLGASQAGYRVFRGGSWHDDPRRCRSAQRGEYAPEPRINNIGFRVARDQSPR